MKLSQVLCAQHIGRMTKKHWYVQSKVKVNSYQSHVELEKLGIPIVDPLSLVSNKVKRDRFEIDAARNPHPDFEEFLPKQDKTCYSYKDSSLFIEGLPQAKLLLKTVDVEDSLPNVIENSIKDVPESVENQITRIIKTSTIFDAHQEKLPKRKHPEKLMWNYERDYGITSIRKTHNLCYKLLNLCELVSGVQVVKSRSVILNGLFSAPFEKESDFLQFKMLADIMVTSDFPLRNIYDKESYSDRELQSIYPSHPTIGMKEENEYKVEYLYPLKPSYSKHHLHTIFVYYDLAEMKNITERPIKEDQILARSLAKCFTATASYAQQKFGSDVKDLPEPVSVHCIQCDGQQFHFSVFQLNTLNLDGIDGLKNYWWSMPRINLYEKAGYEAGKPVLEGYNPEVFKKILAFYCNS